MSIYAQKPWLTSYDKETPKTLLPYPNITLHEQLEDTAKRFPNNIACIFSAQLPLVGRKGASYTWHEINDAASRLSAGLADLGIKKGDVVAIMMPNCVQFVIAAYAVFKAGGILSATNPTYPADKLAHQIADSKAKVMICLTMFYETFKGIQGQTQVSKVVVTNIKEYMSGAARFLFTLAKEKKTGHKLDNLRDGDVWFHDLLSRYKAEDQPKIKFNAEKDVALFQYTGGTTGVSKGAMATHQGLVANTMNVQHWLHSDDPSRDRNVGAIPFFHVYGLIAVVFFSASTGSSMIIVPNARDVTDVVGAMHTYRPTIFACVPALYTAISNHPLIRAGKADLSSLKVCISGSAPLAPDTKRTFEELTGATISEGFGMSECPTATHFNPLGRPGKNQSIGTPMIDVECKIVSLDDGVTEMPLGEPGELILRSPNTMTGYLNMPTETANTLRDLGDGGKPWLYTGDIARMDEEGYFFIVDRKKDMALIGGFNVYPNNVEKVIADHPAVREVGVASVPHPEKEGQETLLACVVLHDGKTVSKEELISFQGKKLANYEIARRIVFVKELPKTAVGKVLRRELAKMVADMEKK
ncbi:MAG TPA: long-chain fatty acid--CoA ligase [Anaerolineales bacterium]|nr:long-chain fatty acid--CoA ligase [Anaerolineales bacterium]